MNQYYQTHKKEMIANAARWYKLNPEKVAKIMRSRHYWQKYGITPKIYEKLLYKQNGCCAICGRHCTMFSTYFCVDEDPFVHLPRGLLCNGCNRIVGQYEHGRLKNKNLIQKIEIYLAKY
jgi:hypothetical protein